MGKKGPRVCPGGGGLTACASIDVLLKKDSTKVNMDTIWGRIIQWLK